MHPRALDSPECFLPPRGDFNLRCTRERYKRWLPYISPISRHGHTDKGRVESVGNVMGGLLPWVHREPPDFHREPPDFHIFLIYPPVSAGGESATFPRMFSSSARRF